MRIKDSFFVVIMAVVLSLTSSEIQAKSYVNEAFQNSYETNMLYNQQAERQDAYYYKQLNPKQKRMLDRVRGLYFSVASIIRPQIDPIYMSCSRANMGNEYMTIQCFKQNYSNFTTPNEIRKMMKAVRASDDEYHYIEYYMNGWYNFPGTGPRYPSAVDAMGIK